MTQALTEASTTKEHREGAEAKATRLAGLIGPILIPSAISEVVNLHIWASNLAPLTYLVGILWFVAGFLIIRAHNRWTLGWPVTITLLGWFLVLGGLFRMFLPEAQQGNQNTPVLGTYAVNAVLVAIGGLLTVKAYWPWRRHTPSS